MERRPVRLDALVEDIQRQAAVLGQEQGIEVLITLVQPATVLGDELRLRELVLNLVENAVKYSGPGGRVEMALEEEESVARLTVTDHGIGIPAEAQSRIFDRFYRTDDARAHDPKGTGLGLAICKWIAEVHQGRIEVHSELGKGSRFTLILPLAVPAG